MMLLIQQKVLVGYHWVDQEIPSPLSSGLYCQETGAKTEFSDPTDCVAAPQSPLGPEQASNQLSLLHQQALLLNQHLPSEAVQDSLPAQACSEVQVDLAQVHPS